jgi:hypothetical protein
MKTEREALQGDLREGAFLYCIHCERAYPKGKCRIMSDIGLGLMRMCPYEDCDGDGILDAWEWDVFRQENHPEYPEVPEEGKIYPMYGKEGE